MLEQADGIRLRIKQGREQGTLCAADERLALLRNTTSEHGGAVVSNHDSLLPTPSRAVPAVLGQASTTATCDFMEDDDDVDGFCSNPVTDIEDSDPFWDVGENGGTEVVFVKEGVAVRPSRHEHIMGRLSLVKQHCVTFLAWLPYSHGTLHEDGTFHVTPCSTTRLQLARTSSCGDHTAGKDRTMYAVHPFPLSDVKAIRKQAPRLGWHNILVVLVNGVTLPPFYFYKGGMKAFLSALKQHVILVAAVSDPDTLMVNDTADPLQRSLTSLELTDVLQGAPPAGSSATFALPMPPPGDGSHSWTWTTDPGDSSSGSGQGPGVSVEPSWRLLSSTFGDTLTRIVQNAGVIANTTGHWLFSGGDVPPLEDQYALELQHALAADSSAASVGTTAPASAAPAASPPLAAGTRPPLACVALYSIDAAMPRLAHWGHSSSSLVAGQQAKCDPAATGGSAALSAAAAEALTSEPDATGRRAGASSGGAGDVAVAAQSCEGSGDSPGTDEFEVVETGAEEVLQRGRRRARAPPLSIEEWESMFDAEGCLLNDAAFRERVFASGVEPALRREVWKYLLGLNPPRSTATERTKLASRRRAEYEVLRQQWMSITPQQAERFGRWRERRSRVEKDVRRTDRALPFYAQERGPNTRALHHLLLTAVMWNFDLGYCQGMSDLASPLLYVMCDESEAFWAFTALLDRMEGNFSSDQQGMHAQLLALRKLVQVLDPQLHAFLERKDALNYFFCFRWLLILFKREFRFEEAMRLWEALWSCPLTPHLHLYLCVAVLVHHRRAIMEQDLDFDGLLKFCVDLSGRMELSTLLRLAEALCAYAGDAGRDCLLGLPKVAL